MPDASSPSGDRINKYLAHRLGISRREIDELITSGAISVDGKPAIIGQRVTNAQQVTLHGKPLSQEEHRYTYVMFHKPVGYVCSRRKQGSDETIYALLPKKYRRLKPVGRLDRDSSGLLLLTDDGDFSHRMTHPSFYKVKLYNLTLDQDLQPLHQQMINDHGITLEDGVSQLGLERLSEKDRRHWRISMSQGRNRQIRRTFSALGYTVTTLHRTDFGTYRLHDLKPGDTLTLDQPS